MIRFTLLSIATVAVVALVSSSAASAMPRAGIAASTADGVVLVAKKKPTQRQEIDQSVQSGTVPKRYRSSIPKQYQQYIPWSK
jgi:hypothetical protein